MGQSQTTQNRLVNQWTFVDQLGRFQIYKNQANQLAQKHIVRSDPKIQQSDYLTAYHQRYLPNKPIVNAYDAQFSSTGKSMCQNSSTINVFTQFIPHRLSQVQMLNHGQGMYVLSQALAGFAELFSRVGPFQVHEDLIGFNQQGQVKVWYNPNFADNSVDNDRIILMSTLNPYDFDRKFSQNQEHDMVQDTINAVAKHTKFNQAFLYQAQQLKKLNFNEARRIIGNQIARKAYYVPDHLFLPDKNGIIEKSGIQLKHKHVINPNRPKKGERYPYFMQNAQNQQQIHYLQGQPPQYPYGYDYYNDESSQSSQSDINYNGQGGYYNMNGQNYRIVGEREYQGNNLNQQAIINEVMRNRGYGNGLYADPNYSQVRTVEGNRTDQYYPAYDKYSDTTSQYDHKYQEGHIVVNDGTRQHKKSRTRVVYAGQNQQYQQQPVQDNVRVFQIDGNGHMVQQHHNNTLIPPRQQYIPPQQQYIPPQQSISKNPNYSIVHPHESFQPNLQSASNVHPAQNVHFVHPHESIVRPSQPIVRPNQSNVYGSQANVYQPNYPQQIQSPTNLHHRHRIFENRQPHQLVRESVH